MSGIAFTIGGKTQLYRGRPRKAELSGADTMVFAYRELLQLEPGDTLEMKTVGEQITLRPVRGTGQLTKEHGVWVFRTGQTLAAWATDKELRQSVRNATSLISARRSDGLFRYLGAGADKSTGL